MIGGAKGAVARARARAKAKNRPAKKRSSKRGRGRPRGSKNSRKPRSPHCGYNKKTYRCNKKATTGRQHCFLRSKTNRCRGRRSKPTNPKNVARGKALRAKYGAALFK